MAKKVKNVIKLAIEAGKANPAPPVGTALGPAGVNIQEFCQQYNDKTKEQIGMVIPAVITVYEDRSFTFITKTPPASRLLIKYAGISKGSANASTTKAGEVTKEQLREIAEIKLPDLNANDIDAAMNIVAGTAKNMGITITE
ncbi:50S ribosomal subunit protein L11 [Erysipelotrichaceae bacterium]|nr:50S ribosomal subunit protein L11 [Erysipelotrichaceae bacterium]